MPARTLAATSTCQKTIATSKLIRSTIPGIVASILELKPGSKLRWEVDVQTGRVTVAKL